MSTSDPQRCRCKLDGELLKSQLEDLRRLHESIESDWLCKLYPYTLQDSLQHLREQSRVIDRLYQVQQLIDVYEACTKCHPKCDPTVVAAGKPRLSRSDLNQRKQFLPDFLTGPFTRQTLDDPAELVYSVEKESMVVRNPFERSKPPVHSLFDNHEEEATTELEPECQDEEHWLIAYGFPDKYTEFVESFLRQLVTVVRIKPGRGNWLFVRVMGKCDVKKAILFNGKLLNNNLMIGIVPYKEPRQYNESTREIDLKPVSVIRPARILRVPLTTKRSNTGWSLKNYVRPSACWSSRLRHMLFR